MDKTLDYVVSKMKKHQPVFDAELDLYIDSLSAKDLRLLAKYGLISICSHYASAFNALKNFFRKEALCGAEILRRMKDCEVSSDA